MPATPVRHQHRHFKTLIVLVLSMTGSTLFLFWVGKLAPVTPLRGKTLPANVWNQVLVRAEDARAARGFFHFRIDEEGRLFQSSAWKNGRHARHSEGAIHILVTRGSPDPGITPTQTRALSRIVAELRERYGIPTDRVNIDHSRQMAGIGDLGES